MKKTLMVILSFVLMAALIACSSNAPSPSPEPSPIPTDESNAPNTTDVTPNRDDSQSGAGNDKNSSIEYPVDAEAVKLEADFIVIGAGPAGLSAACSAAEAGAKVIVFEKSTVTGGAANLGMGLLALESDFQKETNTDVITVDQAYLEFMEYTHYRTDGILVRRYFDLSADTISWLQNMGVEFEEAARYFPKSYPSWHIVKSDDGVITGGGQAATMMRRLTENAQRLGVEFYLETAGREILMDGGKVTGAKALSKDDSKIYEISAPTVLISTGGFGNNAEMVYEELGYTFGEDFFGMRVPNHEGDGILMADAVGAARSEVNVEMIYTVTRPGSKGSAGVANSAMTQPNLCVNQEGLRFFNEEQIQNSTYWGNALAQQTGNTGFIIMDETIKEDYVKNGVPFVSRVFSITDFSSFDSDLATAKENGFTSIQKADTLDELAQLTGINAEALKKTVEEYNAICTSGNDPMGKSSKYLKPIKNGPFYAAQYFPSSYGTLGGIAINSDLEVLSTDNNVIPGLYSAGTDACTIFGDSYMFLLPGNTMGFSVNSGRMAGTNAAAYASGN